MSPREVKNLMEEDKKDVPPADAVRWEVSCKEYKRASREEKGEVVRHAKVIVVARTWAETKEIAFRAFATEHQIYEPEDVEAIVLPEAPESDVSIRDENGQLRSPMVIAGMSVIKKDRRAKKKKAEAEAAAAKDSEETP